MAFISAVPVGCRHQRSAAPVCKAPRTTPSHARNNERASSLRFTPAHTMCATGHADVAAKVPITLDMADDTRLSFRFSLEAATELGHQINSLIASFKSITKAAKDGKRVIEKSLEYRYSDSSLRVDIECNPNVYPDALAAQVYIVVDDGSVKVSSQTLLTRLIENVKSYKAAMSA